METMTAVDAAAIRAQLAQLTAMLAGTVVAPAAPAKASYSVEEASGVLDRKPFTVREWCRLGQCNAYKLPGWKSGPHDRWRISAEEVGRIKEEGLLPANAERNRGKVGVR